MTTVRDTRDFVIKRDLTLTESTGTLIDNAVERAKRELLAQGEAERRAERLAVQAEISALRRQVEQKRLEVAKHRRRARAVVIGLVCGCAIATGWLFGRTVWNETHDMNTASSRF